MVINLPVEDVRCNKMLFPYQCDDLTSVAVDGKSVKLAKYSDRVAL